MEYIVAWSNGIGRVSAGEFLYDIVDKPELGFAYDSVYFETPTNMSMKIVDGEQHQLTDDEVVLCKQFCDTYYASDEFKVFAIDPELRILKGFMSRGECTEQGLEEVIDTEFPEYPLVKRVGDKWERVVAVITESGKLVLLPDGDNPKFNFFFTEEEWKDFPKPTYTDEVFNFQTRTWEDSRKLDTMKTNAAQRIRQLMSTKYNQFNLVSGMEDLVLYLIQAMEASSYNLDSESATPFVDSVVSNMSNETKENFMQRINKHYDPEYLATLGAIHGQMMQALDSVASCNSLQELDAMMAAYENEYESFTWRRKANVDPYASAN